MKDALATGYIEQAKVEADEQAVQVRLAHTNRRVFLGKDRETRYCKMIDSFTYDYYAGNQAQSKVPVYRLDFSTDSTSVGKDYAKTQRTWENIFIPMSFV